MEKQQIIATKRNPCDQCRRRRIRCSGSSPCDRCISADLNCKHDYIPKRRGPKKGVGKVIAQLRPPSTGCITPCLESAPDVAWNSDGVMLLGQYGQLNPLPSPASSSLWQVDIGSGADAVVSHNAHISSIDARMETCLELFLEHIYAIKPVLHRPTLESMRKRPIEIHEKDLIYALCAMTATHMSGRPECINGQVSWISLGRFFLDKCIQVRRSYEFIESRTLYVVLSSYFLFEAYFELDEQRKAWYYLQEAITLAQELGLDNESSYTNLSFVEALCRRRTFWLLFVSERAIAIFRHKPLRLFKTPAYPLDKFGYEGSDIQRSLLSLIQTFTPLNASFVNIWNQSNYDISDADLTVNWSNQALNIIQDDCNVFADSQKADILVTQQWIRLIVWQTALQRGLLSSTSPNPCMTFQYPLEIASFVLNITSTIPTFSIMVHGRGIFEKIYDIACSMIDVATMHKVDFMNSPTGLFSGNPLALFMQILSATPNSQQLYASALEAKAARQLEICDSLV
ncbi:hypothetical protein V490_00985 [Pseudogymnoascus sp. VKM F-3557]|nr:hypothetical protein V490_00985 [Pseudogymnoascus sp. VKM F-3557]